MASVWRFVLAVAVLVTVHAAAAWPAEILNAAFRAPSVNILPVLETVETDQKNVSIELPVGPGGRNLRIELAAEGSGPAHRWAVFTMRNPQLVPQQIILSVPHGDFIGSGVLWPNLPRARMISLQASGGQSPERLDVAGADTFALTINPGFTATYALELAATGPDRVMLWRRAAFEQERSRQAFFQGAVLALAVLLALCCTIIFVIRPAAVFPAAGLFGFAAVAWLVSLSGYLPAAIATVLPDVADAADRARGAIEALLVAGLVAFAATFLELRQRRPAWFWPGAALFLAAVGLAGFALADPVRATGIARMAFAGLALGGLPVLAWWWQAGQARARALLPTWLVLGAWTVAAAAGCLGLSGWDRLQQGIEAGLILVLIAMALALLRIGFGHNVLSRHFLADSGRRALALAGSGQAVWDYQPGGGLHVGPELERALGYLEGALATGDPEDWLDAIHPADRVAYRQAVENAARRGRGSLAQEFRLRRNDGTYRWFLLRARALSEDGRTVRLIGTLTDTTSTHRSEERLLTDAVHDRITGLPNRALFIDRLERAIRRAGSGDAGAVAVIVIDLDRFKTVNDGLGHETADRLLRSAGKRIADLAGPDDTVARLPGDQFAVISAGRASSDALAGFVGSITDALARPFRLEPREIYITASAGVSRLGRAPTSAEALVKDAEIALFEAKRRGSGEVEFFHEGLRDERSRLLALDQDLRQALQRQEIEVMFQPIMRLADRELAGFEALVRWRHGEHGLLEPDAFVSLAEETGLIREIGSFVLSEAARQLGIWQRAFRPSDPLFVAVNISSAQLIDAGLVRKLHGLIGREGILPGTLKLELTETVLMQNPELSMRVLDRIRKLGIGLACDDFGTGYSSFSNLRRLPFDTLKVDRSFIEADGVDERAGIILDSIVLLAHDLGLGIVAEGVESDEQLERVAEIGCDFAQGYFIGVPVTGRQVIDAFGGLRFDAAHHGRTGLAGLWERLAGPAEPDGAPAIPPPRPSQAGALADEDEGEPLEPWTPPERDASTTLFEWASRAPTAGLLAREAEPAIAGGDAAQPSPAGAAPQAPRLTEKPAADAASGEGPEQPEPDAAAAAEPVAEAVPEPDGDGPVNDLRAVAASRLGARLRRAAGRTGGRRAAE